MLVFVFLLGVMVWNVVVFEMVMIFGFVYMVYVIVMDLKKGNMGIIVFIVMGFIVGVNILVGGVFDGVFMNLVVFFGFVVVSWMWDSYWVYWFGFFVGVGIVVLIYEILFIN